MSATSSGETASATSSMSPGRRSRSRSVRSVISMSVDDARAGRWRRGGRRPGSRPRKPSATTTSTASVRSTSVGDLVTGVAGVGRHQRAAGVRRGERGDHPVDAVGRPDARPGRPARSPRATIAGRGLAGPGRAARRTRSTSPPSTYAGLLAEPLRGRPRARPGSCSSHRLLWSVQRRDPTKQLLGRVALVDLTYSEEDQAFRAEVRAWLEEHLSGEWAALRGLGGAGRDHEAHDERLAWNRLLAEHGWTCVGLADGVRRPRAEPGAAGDLPRGVRQGRRAGAGQPPRRGAARPDPDGVRHRRSRRTGSCRRSWRSRSCGRRATPSPTPAPTWPTCRPGPASTADAWVDRRAEGVDLQRPLQPVGVRRLPHRARLRAPPRPLLPAGAARPGRASTSARSSSSPAARSSTRSSSPAPAPPPTWWSASPARAGRSRWRCSASSAASRCSAQVVGFARELDGVVELATETARSTTRSCATGWPGSRSSSR